MEAYQGVAVAALVVDGEGREVERGPAVALGYRQPVRCEHGGDGLAQRPAERLRVPVWRIEEDQIVLTGVLACAAQEGAGVAAHDLRLPDPGEVGAYGADRRGVAVDERGARRAAR